MLWDKYRLRPALASCWSNRKASSAPALLVQHLPSNWGRNAVTNISNESQKKRNECAFLFCSNQSRYLFFPSLFLINQLSNVFLSLVIDWLTVWRVRRKQIHITDKSISFYACKKISEGAKIGYSLTLMACDRRTKMSLSPCESIAVSHNYARKNALL